MEIKKVHSNEFYNKVNSISLFEVIWSYTTFKSSTQKINTDFFEISLENMN